jgi:hypothetical protein
MNIIDTLAKEQQKTDVTKFKVGDGVRVQIQVWKGGPSLSWFPYGWGEKCTLYAHEVRLARDPSLAMWPAAVASTIAYRRDVGLHRGWLLPLGAASLAGGLLGGQFEFAELAQHLGAHDEIGGFGRGQQGQQGAHVVVAAVDNFGVVGRRCGGRPAVAIVASPPGKQPDAAFFGGRR